MTGVALYGRTYLDAEVTIPLESLATGKGKVDVEVTAVLGGFPCNAARALASRLSDITVVTRISSLDLPRLRAALPPGTVIHAVATDSEDWPPVTVIVNPAQECRLLRSGRAGDLAAADVTDVPSAALHIFGRVDPSLVAHVEGARAWCAGAGNEINLCDLACVNTAEARAILGRSDGSPRELAVALLSRAQRDGAVRVVTGRGDAPTAAATHDAVYESAPAPIPRDQIRTFKGVGDVFAAHFFVEAVLDARGERRRQLEVERALAMAQAAAGKFMTR
jgi:sugar/nucleoside kinase (ribokinase family)